MIIALTMGSRADCAGMWAIDEALHERGVSVVIDTCDHTAIQGDVDAVVVLGDRYEVCARALRYRQAGIKIAHIHAGEISGQEPDDTYRDVISRMSQWLFVPHQTAYDYAALEAYENGQEVFNCGSPFITSAYNTKLVDVKWPGGNGKKVFVAFNPLPENGAETREIRDALDSLWRLGKYRLVCIAPNNDRNKGVLEIWAHDMELYASLPHAEYLSYMASADAILGNTSAGLIENCVYGVPYVCVGSRQFCREHGPNVRWCKPEDMGDMLQEALEMEKQPSDTYGDKDSAEKIAEVLIREVEA